MGGQGAPLAPFFHHACARWVGAVEPVALLNLGGVGNVTWVDPSIPSPADPGALVAFDTGPANAPINDLLQSRRGLAQDEGGALALSGAADAALVEAFLNHGYFYKMPPKSLDRNDFHNLLVMVRDLPDADACATLVACAAAAVARGGEHFPKPVRQIWVCGGGRHNRALMAALSSRIAAEVLPIDDVGLDGDMLEAQAFAYLAVRVARGLPTSAPMTTGVAAAIGGGKISRPTKDARPLSAPRI